LSSGRGAAIPSPVETTAGVTGAVATQLADHAVLPCSDLHDCPNAYVGVLPYGKTYYRNPDVISKLPTAFSVYAQILLDDFVGGWVYATPFLFVVTRARAWREYRTRRIAMTAIVRASYRPPTR
jgi:hypothetical protein